jgi:GNAT superfamily N-acetyltransferase
MEDHMAKRLKWIEKMMPHLQIIVALGTRKSRKGLIEYLPIEMAPEPVKGKKSFFINCIWVLPRFKKVGIGTGLMQHVLDDAKKVGGASVIAYEGDKWFEYFDYMPAGYFKRFGFREVSRDGARVLLHLDLGAHMTPRLLTPKNYRVEENGKTVVDVFCNSQCPWCGWMADEVERNVKGSELTIRRVNTDSREVIEEFGLARGISINGSPVVRRMASWKEIESTFERAKSS